MKQSILDEIAFLFVKQFDNLYGMLTDRTDVKRIRHSVDGGENALFSVVAEIFGNRLDQIILDITKEEMDYIAYISETWNPKDDNGRAQLLEAVSFHLGVIKAILKVAQEHRCNTVNQIKKVLAEAERLLGIWK